MAVRSVAAMVLLAASAFARTDIAGCTYYDSVVHATPAYATRIWYVPDTGEVCEILDCGGGRAPPKTTVPGCAAYSGTATYEPKFIDPKTLGGQHAVSTTSTSVVAPTKTGAAVTTVLTTAAPAVTSASTIESTADAGAPNTSSSTGVAPNVSTTVSPSQGNSNGTNTAIKTTVPTAGAVPTAAAVLGSCLIAGVAACLGMM